MRPRWSSPAAAVAALAGTPVLAANAPFTETYNGNTYDIAAPILQDGVASTATLTLANDALSVVVSDSTRTSLVLDVPNAAPTPGLAVTQSVDFTMTNVFTSVSRLGFVFGANPPEAAGEGDADAIYTYLREPSGDFAPARFFTNAFDETGAQIGISNTDDAAAGVPSLAENVTYTFTSTVTFEGNGDHLIDFNVVDTATGGTGYDQSYSFTIPADEPPVGEEQLTIDGTHYGLYVRHFDPAAEVVFDNWSVSTVLTPIGITGDYDTSGQVEQGDLDIVLQNWGTGTFTGDEDALVGGGPFDGTVDQNELDGVLQNWGSTSAPDFAGSAVPEPTVLALLSVGGLAMLRRR